jgi:Fe-S-cluster containining protein
VTAALRVRALSIHADYRCRNAGVCCSSGWPIPVEPRAEGSLRTALRSGALRPAAAGECLRPAPGLPHGARVVLGSDAEGRCVFLEGGRPALCAVHRGLGEDALPSACRHFPRVVTLTPLGVSVTLSHCCPTAAAMLFRHDVPLVVTEDPPAFPASWPWEGLDARDALPPFLRPGVLMDWPSLERWERFAVAVLAEDGRTAEAALDVLAGAAEAARRWTSEKGEFAGFFEGVLARAVEGGGPAFPGALRDGLRDGMAGADARWVAPAWPSLARPLRRWLAAKAFASWLGLQGEGLRTCVVGLRVALGVLRAEAARGCAEAGRALDPGLLKDAIRRADLRLVHLSDPEALARRLSRCETSGTTPVTW